MAIERRRQTSALPGHPPSDSLADILERVLDKGIVIAGDIQINLLDIELRLGPVVPFRLCTIYESADGVRAMLEHERTGLASALARLDGMVELGVKGFLARGPVTGAERPTA